MNPASGVSLKAFARGHTFGGAGKITLTAANSYFGGTTVSRGTLEGQTNTAFGSGPIILGDTSTGAENVALYIGNRADVSNQQTTSPATSW